jgi:hypothetical protein
MRMWQCGQYAAPASKDFLQSEQVMVATPSAYQSHAVRVDVTPVTLPTSDVTVDRFAAPSSGVEGLRTGNVRSAGSTQAATASPQTQSTETRTSESDRRGAPVKASFSVFHHEAHPLLRADWQDRPRRSCDAR